VNAQHKRDDANYTDKLDQILEEVFTRAQRMKLNNVALANLTGLHHVTVYRIESYETRLPYLHTVYALARAVGLDVSLVEAKLKRRKSA
jgi:hypothetical protein